MNKKQPVQVRSSRRLVYIEDEDTGELEVIFEGRWSNSDLHRAILKIPRHFLTHKRSLLKQAEEKENDGQE